MFKDDFTWSNVCLGLVVYKSKDSPIAKGEVIAPREKIRYHCKRSNCA